MSGSGIIAIVGRPNVGKSALFNRIAGRRIAIVHDRPGVTRDRVSAEVEWQGRPFTLVDTGGIGLAHGEKSDDIIAHATLDQALTAIESAHVILLVTDIREGVVALDRDVARRLHQSGKPVLVAANKADNDTFAGISPDFAQLGFGELFPVSALHDRGLSEMMEAALALVPPAPDPEAGTTAVAAEPLKIAIVGRPNVGKSSIINSITQSKRVIVSPIPGTTRDAIDVPFLIQTGAEPQPCMLIDTAGLRKARRVDDSVEFFSASRTHAAITRCDVAVLVLDAESGILEQDKKIADIINAEHRACVVVVNKWDLATAEVREVRQRHRVRKRSGVREKRPQLTLAEFGDWVHEQLFFLDYAPVIFTSATQGFQLERLLEAIRYVAAQRQQKVPTPLLNRTLADAINQRQPPSKSGKHLKFFYATQTGQAPPSFLLFVNATELFTEQYSKYLRDCLRKAFGFEGCPLLLRARPRSSREPAP